MTNNKYVVLDTENKAINFILYDGVSEYNPGEGLHIEPLPENSNYGFGWIYDPISKTFTKPNN